MQLIITLRKEVADQAEGQQTFEAVKQKLEDRPDIKVTGHITNHFEEEEKPS